MERELLVGNGLFKKHDNLKYSWLKLMDFMLIGFMLSSRRVLMTRVDVRVLNWEVGGKCDH